MSKETTYQRLKRENSELKQQLYEVVMNPDSIKSLGIKTTVKTAADLEKAVYFGDTTTACNQNFTGLAKQLA